MPNYWFDHVHLNSPDPIGTAEFYEKMFGATRQGVRQLNDGRTLIDLILNGSSIKVSKPRVQPLVPSASPTGHEIEHFGLRTDNIEAAVAELKSNGVKFVTEIRSGAGAKIAFLLAPGDILIELLEEGK